MRVLRKPVSRVSQASRHSEVNQENATAFEPNNQILPASVQRRDVLALELGRDGRGVERTRQAGVEDLDSLECPADEQRLELRSDRLDLG